MAPPQDEPFSEDEQSESPFSSDIDSDDDSTTQKKPVIAVQDKDSDEEDLERLVFGSKVSFGESLFKNNALFGASDEKEGNELELADEEAAGLEDVDDMDLFMIDTAPSGAALKLQLHRRRRRVKANRRPGRIAMMTDWESRSRITHDCENCD